MKESQDVNDDYDPIEIAQGFLSEEYGADSLKTSNILNYYYSVPRYKITKKNTLFDSSG